MTGDTFTKSAMRTMKVAADAVLAGVISLCLWVAVFEMLE